MGSAESRRNLPRPHIKRGATADQTAVPHAVADIVGTYPRWTGSRSRRGLPLVLPPALQSLEADCVRRVAVSSDARRHFGGVRPPCPARHHSVDVIRCRTRQMAGCGRHLAIQRLRLADAARQALGRIHRQAGQAWVGAGGQRGGAPVLRPHIVHQRTWRRPEHCHARTILCRKRWIAGRRGRSGCRRRRLVGQIAGRQDRTGRCGIRQNAAGCVRGRERGIGILGRHAPIETKHARRSHCCGEVAIGARQSVTSRTDRAPD